MASVYELARQLGKELMNTPEVAELLEAKKVYEADTEIVKLIQEYSAMQEDFEIRFAAGKTTEEEQKAFAEEMPNPSWSRGPKPSPTASKLHRVLPSQRTVSD